MTLLSPCYLTAGQASLPKTWKHRMSEGGSGCQMTPLILRGEFYRAAPSVHSGMLSTSIPKHSLLFGPKWQMEEPYQQKQSPTAFTLLDDSYTVPCQG